MYVNGINYHYYYSDFTKSKLLATIDIEVRERVGRLHEYGQSLLVEPNPLNR